MSMGLSNGIILGSNLSGSGSGAFTPAQIAGLNLWLDGSNAGSLLNTGGQIDQWSDLSGQGNHFTGTTTTRPVTGTRTINGLNTPDFDGVDDFLSGTANAALMALFNADNSFFAVAATDTVGNSQSIIRGMNTTNNTRLNVGYNLGTTLLTQDGTAGASNVITVDTTAHALGYIRSANVATANYNGVAQAVTSAGASISLTNLAVGRRGNSNVDPFDGRIAEILVYNAPLSNVQANQVGNYLAAKWGVTWTGL